MKSILTPERTLNSVRGGSKKRILEFLAKFLVEQNIFANYNLPYEQLLARERLGSTGIGYGVAIPHCRLSGLHNTIGILLKLDTPIDFDAIDGQPVDIIFALIVPEQRCEEHLKILAKIARLLQDATQRENLRKADSDQALYQLAVSDNTN